MELILEVTNGSVPNPSGKGPRVFKGYRLHLFPDKFSAHKELLERLVGRGWSVVTDDVAPGAVPSSPTVRKSKAAQRTIDEMVPRQEDLDPDDMSGLLPHQADVIRQLRQQS